MVGPHAVLVMLTMTNTVTSCLEAVAQRAREASVFGGVGLLPPDPPPVPSAVPLGVPSGVPSRASTRELRLECAALASASPAFFRVEREGDRVWVSLVTADRWLSQSIEADLVHTGDKVEELLEEELADLGYTGPKVVFEHFRSEDKLFTFRTSLTVPHGNFSDPAFIHNAGSLLLAYEACFRELGDMNASGDDE